MKITDVKVFDVKGNNKKSSLLAFASITIDDEFVVGGFRIIDGSKGVFVAMPSQLGNDEEYHDQAYPITKEMRDELIGKIMDAYEGHADEDAKEAQKTEKPKRRYRK